MGKKPSVPVYNQNTAIDEQNRINQASANQLYSDVNSPLGGYTTYVDPRTGPLTVNKVLSDNSMNALYNQRAVLGNYTGDGTDAANAYYAAQMAYAQPQLERQVTRGRTALINRGIPLGGRAWNEYMGDIYDAQNQYRSNLANSAISAGQGYQSGILGQGRLLGSQVIDPAMISGQGGAGLENTYDQQFQNQVAQYKTKLANGSSAQQILGATGTIAGALIGAYFGGPMGAAAGASAGGAAGNGIGAAVGY